MTPRVLFSRLPSLFVIPFLFSLAPAFSAQDTARKTQPQVAAPLAISASTKKDSSAAAKARIAQKKALGVSLLVSLANDARNYQDQKLRARTLSRIADALWEADPEQGRALFRKAWDAAEASDQETARRQDEERQRQLRDDPDRPAAFTAGPDLRSDVLRLAAKHDRALGEEFLDKLKDARVREATDTAATVPSLSDTPAAIRQRLHLASQLLDSDVERALQFADPALATITMDGLDFLSSLRDKNPVAADQRYARLLGNAEMDVKSDANTISLLSSYLFTPHLFISFGADGGQSSSSLSRRTPPPEVAPELRNAFFRTAAGVLLRPSPAKEQDRSSSGVQGKYLVIRRLMPLFEQYAPKEIAEQLRGEMSVLGQGIDRDVRDLDEDNPIQPMNTPERKAEDVEKSLLDRIDRAKTSAERDAIYLQQAARAAQKGDMRARDFTEKIEDSDLRAKAKPYVDMNLAMSAAEKKDTEKALLLASKGELSHIQRVWLLTEAASAMPPSEHEQALQTVAEALAEARRIDVSDPDRPHALVAVANALLPLDRTRAWEMMLEVAKASNSAEGFNGEDGRITMQLRTKNMSSMRISTIDEFNLQGVFRLLSQENASQAIELARSFENEAPRATALIAVARALLSEKK
ncbi:MAG TPA: hypothetical protein VKC61_08570 [Pyrinomonadaceae bacterium]|nr:hypothetical protein [Pyrinomonadaceae bacterium]